MNRLRYKLATFMQGRYGPDDLYKGCMIFYLILLIVQLFFKSRIVLFLLSATLIWTFFRFFSRNIAARQKENAFFLSMKFKVKKAFSSFKTRLCDRKHIYRKCHECHATLRFPRKRGKHTARCPKCGKELKINILF